MATGHLSLPRTANDLTWWCLQTASLNAFEFETYSDHDTVEWLENCDKEVVKHIDFIMIGDPLTDGIINVFLKGICVSRIYSINEDYAIRTYRSIIRIRGGNNE